MATIAQITTHYNQGVQRTISECTTSKGPLVPTEHCWNTTAYLLQDNTPSHKTQIISTWLLEHDHSNGLHSQPITKQLCVVVERDIHITHVQLTNLSAAVHCCHVSMDQTLRGMFPATFWGSYICMTVTKLDAHIKHHQSYHNKLSVREGNPRDP